MAIASLVISGLTVLTLATIGIILGRRGADAPVHDVPLIASSALAWGGAFLQAFATSSGALRRDRAAGIQQLVLARTLSIRGYVLGRVGGLAVWLLVAVSGGSLVIGLASLLGATQAHAFARTLQATIASAAYGLAFALVVAPVAFAALGSRTRAGGYLALLGIIVLPEVFVAVAGGPSGPLPNEVAELCALPSALAALRSSLAPESVDAWRFLRAFGALAVFAIIATSLVRRDAVVLERDFGAAA
jgi:hypothetical protein